MKKNSEQNIKYVFCSSKEKKRQKNVCFQTKKLIYYIPKIHQSSTPLKETSSAKKKRQQNFF